MASPSWAQLLAARQIAMQTADTTLAAGFTPSANPPTFEVSQTLFPNNVKGTFLDFIPGSSQNLTFDWGSVSSLTSGIISIWIKPDFDQTYGSNINFVDGYKPTPDFDAIQLQFDNTIDDWKDWVIIDNSVKGNATTAGQTWTVDSVIHMVFMWEKSAGLDNSKSVSMYINNNLVASDTVTWADTGDDLSTTSKIGSAWNNSAFMDGGLYDFACFDYATLAASFTDAEIVQAMYSNTLGASGQHKFMGGFDGIQPVPTAPSNCYISNITTTGCRVNWTDNSSDETGFKVYKNGVLLDTTAAGATYYDVTGLAQSSEYYFYIIATNAAGDSSASNTIYMMTTGAGLSSQGRLGRLRGGQTTATVLDWADGIRYMLLKPQTVTAAYTVDSARPDCWIRASGNFTVTLPMATSGRLVIITNYGTGTITIGGTVNGVSNPTLEAGQTIGVGGNGTNWNIIFSGATLSA